MGKDFDTIKILDMSLLDKKIKGKHITRIESENTGIIRLPNLTKVISPENPIDISFERKFSPGFNILCNATCTPENSICLSRAEWSCFQGAKLVMYEDNGECIKFEVK